MCVFSKNWFTSCSCFVSCVVRIFCVSCRFDCGFAGEVRNCLIEINSLLKSLERLRKASTQNLNFKSCKRVANSEKVNWWFFGYGLRSKKNWQNFISSSFSKHKSRLSLVFHPFRCSRREIEILWAFLATNTMIEICCTKSFNSCACCRPLGWAEKISDIDIWQ